MMQGMISLTDRQWMIDGYPIHPCQSWLVSHDLSSKSKNYEDIFYKMHKYTLEYNPGNGPWLYAVVDGLRSSRNYDLEW